MSKPGERRKLPDYFAQEPLPVVIANPKMNSRGIIVSRRIHLMYEIHEKIASLQPNLPQLFGKYQYFYESEKGVIDLITQPEDLFFKGAPEVFEICSNSKFFDGPEKYTFRKDAEKRIMEFLATK